MPQMKKLKKTTVMIIHAYPLSMSRFATDGAAIAFLELKFFLESKFVDELELFLGPVPLFVFVIF